MQLLIYAAASNAAGRVLRERIQSMEFESVAGTIYCSSIMALDKNLRQPLGLSPIGIMIPSDDSELVDLIGMRHLLRGMRVILVLPNDQPQNIIHSRAHLLRPRFITYADAHPKEIIAVLWKMIGAACAAAG
jgi:hypothetical protein